MTDYHFEIYTTGVRTVMERVRDYCFQTLALYVMEQQKNSGMSWRKTSWFYRYVGKYGDILSGKIEYIGSGKQLTEKNADRKYGSDEELPIYPELP